MGNLIAFLLVIAMSGPVVVLTVEFYLTVSCSDHLFSVEKCERIMNGNMIVNKDAWRGR